MADQELIAVIKQLTKAMQDAKAKEKTKKDEADSGGGIKYDASTEEGLRRQKELRLFNLELQAEEQKLLNDLPGLYETVLSAEKELMSAIALRDEANNDLDAQAQANLAAQIESLEEFIDQNKELVKEFDNLTAAQKRARQAGQEYFNGALKFFGVGGNLMGTMVGKMIKMSQVIGKGGFKQVFKGIGAAISNIPLFVLASVVEKTISWALATDKAQQSVARSIGGNQKYTESIAAQTHALGQLGIEAQKVDDAYKALLSTTISSRISQDGPAAAALVDQATKLDALGVSISTTMQVASSLNARGFGVEQITATTNELMRMGEAIGVTTKDMMDGFAKASGTLAVYGPRIQTQIFGKLASMAKAAGVEVADLLKVAGKFDTFDSAAKTVAGLNAVLGTQFSQTEMLMMTEEQRLETVMTEFKMKGIQFSQMDRFKQKLIAEQLGFKNADEAAKVLNGTYDEYRKNSALAAEQAAKQKTVDDAMKNSEDIRMKMKIWFHNFVAEQGPAMLDWGRKFIGWLQAIIPPILRLVENLGGLKNILIGLGIAKVVFMLIRWRKATTAVTMAQKALIVQEQLVAKITKTNTLLQGKNAAVKGTNASATGTLAAAEAASVAPKVASGKASLFSAKGLLAIGFAIGVATLGIGFMVSGLGDLANGFKDLGAGGFAMFATTLGAIAIGLWKLSAAMMAGAGAALASAPGLFVIAGVALLIGLAVGIAAAGLGKLADGFANIILGIAEVGKTGLEGAAAIGALGIALYFVVPALFASAGGFMATAAGASAAAPILLGFGIGLAIIMGIAVLFVDKIAKMAHSFHQLAVVSAESSTELLKVMNAFGGLGRVMTMLGNPLALIGGWNLRKTIKSLSQYAAEVARIAEANSDIGASFTNMLSSAVDVDFSGMKDQIAAVGGAMNTIDAELGTGDKRIEILTVLESLATMNGDDLSNSVRQVHLNKLAVTAEVTRFDPKEYQVNDFDIKLGIDGYNFKTYIEEVIAEYNKKV